MSKGKTRSIRAVGVSCINGKEFRLNVTGRNSALQLFQVAVPGITTFWFVNLPQVMSKRDALAFLVKELSTTKNVENGMVKFLTDKLTKLDAVLNKVPGKRGRPKKVVAVVESKPEITTVKISEKVVAKITPQEPVPVTNAPKPVASLKEKAEKLAQIRAMSQKAKAQV